MQQPPKTTATRQVRRVALFTGAYNHVADGVAFTLNRLVAYLLRSGVDVRIIAPTVARPALKHHGVLLPAPSIALPGRQEYRFSYLLSRRVRSELDRFAPDLVHIATPDLIGYSALRWARARGLPVVSTYHTHFGSYLKYYRLGFAEELAWRYLRHFYRLCDELYVPSAAMLEELKGRGVECDLRIWPRGVDTTLFNPARRSAQWRRSQGLSPDLPTICFVSRLVWEKGLAVFASVVEKLRDRGPQFQTLIVGDGPARATLEARLTDAHFTGHLSGRSLAQAYASTDIFLFPSDTETFGNVVLEAMASGVAVVGADYAGIAELVEHRISGLLAPAGEVDAFTHCTETLLNHSDLRQACAAAALERAQRYRWDAVLKRMLSYYEDVLVARPTTKPEAPPPRAVPLDG